MENRENFRKFNRRGGGGERENNSEISNGPKYFQAPRCHLKSVK